MDAMAVVGNGHAPSRSDEAWDGPGEYVVELDLADFTEGELSVEARGHVITVRRDRLEADETEGFRLHERLEESFRLPEDAEIDRITAIYDHGTLDIHAPRAPLKSHVVAIEHPARHVNPDAAPC